MVCFLFSRPTLVELRVLPCCPITLWVYTGETCSSCNLRIGLFGICIEDWLLFRTRSEDFDLFSAYVKFCRVYASLIERYPFLEQQQRKSEKELFVFTQWVNTSTDERCAHCLRILTSRLIIDDYIDLNYWKYLRVTSEYRRKAKEICFVLCVTLFEELIEMGGKFNFHHKSRL